MKQYATELREPYRGDRWVGPVVEADSFLAAKRIMRDSPYRVIGELLFAVRTDGQEISRYIQCGSDAVAH